MLRLPESEHFYELADFALIPAAFTQGDYPSFWTNYQRYLNDTLVHSGYFCRAADKVLAEVALILGFELETENTGVRFNSSATG